MKSLCFVAIILGTAGSYLGLLASFYGGYPSGPSIIVVMGFFYMISILSSALKLPQARLKLTTWFVSFLVGTSMVTSSSFATTKLSSSLRIVVSFSLLKDIVEQLIPPQEEAHVQAIVGPDGDSHTYEPTPQDMQSLAKAHLIVVNGWGFEHWMHRLIEASGYTGEIVVATQGLTPRSLIVGGRSIPDPHAWHDLRYTIHYVQQIAAALIKVRPLWKDAILQRKEAYCRKLQDLHIKFYQAMQKFPAEDRCAVVTHDAFGYLGTAYGLTFFSPLGISTKGEPSAQDLKDIIVKVRQKKGGCCILLENISPSHLMCQVAQELQFPVVGTLYSDALSPATGPASTFISMVEYNLGVLEKAFKDVQDQKK